MNTFHRLLVISLIGSLLAGPALAQASQPALNNSQAHYVSECKNFVMQKLYEPALFSCYNAYQLGSTDMGAVLYQLGKNQFFDEVTSNNLIQAYSPYKGSPEIQRFLMNITFTSQSDEVVQGSIYGSWCLDEDSRPIPMGLDFTGYKRLVINPTGEYIQASSKFEHGRFQYSNNLLTLGHPNFGQYRVITLTPDQLILKTQEIKPNTLNKTTREKTQVYSRKACTKQGLQRFIQVLVNNKSSKNCDEISNYLGPQLIPTHYLPMAIVNTLKQDPKGHHCPLLIEKIRNSQNRFSFHNLGYSTVQ